MRAVSPERRVRARARARTTRPHSGGNGDLMRFSGIKSRVKLKTIKLRQSWRERARARGRFPG